MVAKPNKNCTCAGSGRKETTITTSPTYVGANLVQRRMPQLQGAVMRLAAVVALSTTAAVDGMAGTFKGTVSPPRGFNNYCTHQGLADEQWQLGQATHLAAQLLASG